MDALLILETEHTTVHQARSFRLPGYLIVAPLAPCQRLADLDADQAADLLKCLALSEAITLDVIEPARVYVLKFGR